MPPAGTPTSTPNDAESVPAGLQSPVAHDAVIALTCSKPAWPGAGLSYGA